MSDKPVQPGDLRSLWQSMPTEPVVITPYEMRMRAALFEGRIRRRNRVEYIACAIVIAVFCWYATFRFSTILWPIANLMIAAATIYVGISLHRKGKAAATPDSGTVGSLVEFHRRELVRQRDALKSVWRWYLLPVVPGMILWFVAMWLGPGQAAAKPEAFAVGLGMTFAFCLLVFVTILFLNLLGAARLQRMIDDLDRYKEKE
ncbi:MAG TPA: hypothetical protein VFV70_08565 [Hyphomonadaceae bacterium]|nr:hypothetical protein [Hyphomonadaceae bacterium]